LAWREPPGLQFAKKGNDVGFNDVAHRDYASAAAVQVSVFADRLEVWNPGELPQPLTPERLRQNNHNLL
jgi:predicted HTH transcriptional regulator